LAALFAVGCASRHLAPVAVQEPEPEPAGIGVQEFGPVEGPLEEDEQSVPALSPDISAAVEACRGRLQTIADALRAYRAAHGGAFPSWLSELVPDHLPDAGLLLCPADAAGGDPLWENGRDPHLPTSYVYELAPTRYDQTRALYRRFGAVVPLIRCWHHLDVPLEGQDTADGNETVLNISHALEVHASTPEWREDDSVRGRVFRRLEEDIGERDSAALAQYPFGVLELLDADALAALERLLLAAAADPSAAQNGGLQKLLGALYRRQKVLANAVAAYERAAALLPQDAQSRFLLGSLYGAQGDLEAAARAYAAGLAIEPDTVDVLLELARIRSHLGDRQGVQDLYGQLRRFFRPESYGYRFALADVAYLLGDDDRAVESFEWLVAHIPAGTGPGDPTLRFIMGRLVELYERRGDAERAQMYRVRIDPGADLVGKPAPAVVGEDVFGKTVRYAGFNAKPALVNFWASTSPYCQRQMPYLRAIQQQYGEAIALVGVNRESNRRAEMLFAAAHAPYPVVYGADATFEAYLVQAVPTLYILDRRGVIRHRKVGFREGDEAELQEQIEKLLAEPAPEPGKPE
jgi:tetratricopeptide (TPR) repeat protein